MNYQCQECQSYDILIEHYQLAWCQECGSQIEMPVFGNRGTTINQNKIIKRENNYVKKGVQQQLKTEYSTFLKKLSPNKNHNIDLLNKIIDDNEQCIGVIKSVVQAIVRPVVAEKYFKRNLLIDMKSVVTFLLMREDDNEGLDNLMPLLKHNSDLHIKKVLMKIKEGKQKKVAVEESKSLKLKYLFTHY